MEDMTLLNQLAFWLFAGLMIVGALGVVFHRSIIYSALLLLVSFLAIAGVFVLLNAPFIAAAQVLVYAVGLTIVLLFGIMLTGDKPFADAPGEHPRSRWFTSAVVSVAVMGFAIWALLNPSDGQVNGLFKPQAAALTKEAQTQIMAMFADGGITHIGELLFSKYLVSFELASVLLLLAMIGAIILSKRVLPEEEGEPLLPGEVADAAAMLEQGLNTSACDRVSPVDSEKQTLGVS